jgi:hypothetical protein
MNMTLFLEAYNSFDGAMTMNDIAARAAKRFDESITINPYFYYGPYTGMVARNAGYAFTGRILSNHSVEYPRGGNLSQYTLTHIALPVCSNLRIAKEVFASFFGVYEVNGKLAYKKGWEQIPTNWYRLAVDYGLVDLNLDIVDWVMQYPQLGSVGGNLGKVNSFAGLDMEDITGGVLNSASLLEGNNLACFTLEVVKTFAPNSLSTLFKTLQVPLQILDNALLGPLLDLSCPDFKDLTLGGTDLLSGLLATYPGAQKSGFAL